MGEPCGMPRRLSLASVVRVFLPRSSVSSTGHSSHILIRCSTRRSTTRHATDFNSSARGCSRSSLRGRTRAVTVFRDTLSEGFSHSVTSMTAPVASAGAFAGWDLHPLERAALSRRTGIADSGQPKPGRFTGSRQFSNRGWQMLRNRSRTTRRQCALAVLQLLARKRR